MRKPARSAILTSIPEVTVELKNDISIRGTLKSVDQYLNIKLDDITVLDDLKYPHMV
jgi:small nuclear ribonucleoprotein (snRNP)-like protein